MWKRALIAAAATAAFATPSHAEILFYGLMTITAVDNCPNGPNKNDKDNAHFHPKGAPGNADFSALNVTYRWGGRSWYLEGKSFGEGFKKVTNVSIGWANYTPDQPSFVSVTTQDPDPIKASTKSITLEGQIKNPNGNTGEENCVVTFTMVGVKGN